MSIPELLVGTAKTNLGETLFMKVLLADNFYFELAPLRPTAYNSLEVAWDTITFDAFQPQRTPQQVTSRPRPLLTSPDRVACASPAGRWTHAARSWPGWVWVPSSTTASGWTRAVA